MSSKTFRAALALTAAICLGGAARAEPSSERLSVRSGDLFVPGKTTGPPLFHQISEYRTTGSNVVITSVITDAAGKPVMTEEARMRDGQIQSQTMDQLQIQERYELTATSDQIVFKTYSLAGETPTVTAEKTIAKPVDFVTGPSTEAFFLRNKSALFAGQPVEAAFGIFEMQSWVKFKFEPRSTDNNSEVLKLTMKVASFWLGLVVDTIQIDVDRTRMTMTRFSGRTPVRVKVGSKWEPLDAEILYTTVDKSEGSYIEKN